MLHPVHICIIVSATTLAVAKWAEKTYRFALALTLTVVAGTMIATATTHTAMIASCFQSPLLGTANIVGAGVGLPRQDISALHVPVCPAISRAT